MKLALIIAVLLPLVACDMRTGGPTPYKATLTDTPVAFANNAINVYFQKQNSLAPRTAEKILSATSQVVAGIKYKYTLRVTGGDQPEICDVTVWARTWLKAPENYKNLGVSCKNEVEKVPAPALGGEEPASLDDVQVQQALSALVDSVNAKSNSMFRVTLLPGSATKQIVNGWVIRFKNMKMVQTTCTNTNIENYGKYTLEDCPENANSVQTPQTCTGQVLWNSRSQVEYKVQQADCAQTETPKAAAPFTISTARMDDDDVQRALIALVDRINVGCNCLNRKIPDGTSGIVTKRVEEGLVYHFTGLKMVDTKCANSDASSKGKITAADCAVDAKSTATSTCGGHVHWSPLALSGARYTVLSYKC